MKERRNWLLKFIGRGDGVCNIQDVKEVKKRNQMFSNKKKRNEEGNGLEGMRQK